MLSNLLYFVGALALAWLISGIFLTALVFAIGSSTTHLLAANGGALVACELLYRTFDARFYFPRGELIYVAAQLVCLGNQWLLMAMVRNAPQQQK